MPKVSVIVPNYNHASYLEQRIESILNQSFTDFELILLDDKSTDDSDAILRSYTSSHDKVRYFPNEVNSGSPFHQWNKGVELASGEYFWIAESDDFCEPNILEKLVSILDQNSKVGIAYAQSWLVDEQGEKMNSYAKNLEFIYKTNSWETDFVKKGSDANREWLLFHNPIPNASGALFRKKAFVETGKADVSMKLNGDWYVYARILAKWDLAFCAEHLNYFRVHTQTQRSRLRKTASIYHEIIKLINFIRDNTPNTEEPAGRAFKKIGNWWVGSLPKQGWSRANFKSNLMLFNTFRKYKRLLILGILITYCIFITKRTLSAIGLLKPLKNLRSKMFPGKYFEY